MKGNAAIYGFEHFAGACHRLEDAMELDEAEPCASSLLTLSGLWRESLDSFTMFLAHDSSDGVALDSSEYSELIERLEQRHDHGTLLRTARRWAHPRMALVLGIYARTVKQLATRFGKDVEVAIVDNGLRLPRSEMRWFLTVLVHVVRNAVDHGIETPEARTQSNKPSKGRITIESAVDNGMFIVSVTDDGCGVDWENVRRRAIELGVPHKSHADLEAALFHDGLSTKTSVSDISGRGVGLGAVIDCCKQFSGSATVTSEPRSGTRFEFRFMLPSLVPTALRPIVSAQPSARPQTESKVG